MSAMALMTTAMSMTLLKSTFIKNGNSLSYLSPAEITARNGVEPGRYAQPGQASAGNKTGYAYDGRTGQTVLTNPVEAQQNGYSAFRPVSEANIRNTFSRKKIGAAVPVIKGKERRSDWTLSPSLIEPAEKF